MKVDIETAMQLQYDCCIVGAGPAGIIVALECQRLRPEQRILLIEFGIDRNASRNRLDDTIRIANLENHCIPYECTNKGLGGTSASWGGRCVMYDEIDFMQRNILGGQCTWDTSLFNEASQYAGLAARYFECGDGIFNLQEIPAFANSRIAEGFQAGDVTDSAIERWSMPTRFADRYGPELDSSKTIHWVAGWEASLLARPTDDGVIEEIGLRDFAGTRAAKVRARKFVIAAGTQETTRLLLKNKAVFRLRGGPPPSLGKYYQGHVSGKIAGVVFNGDPRKTDYGFLRTADGVYLRRRFQLSQQVMLDEDLLNTSIWLDNPLYVDPAHLNGAMSFMYLAMITPGLGRKLAPPAIAHSITKNKVSGIPQHLGNILKDLPQSLSTPASIFLRRYCARRKLPGVFLYSPRNTYALHFHAEQVPVEENCMEIGPDGETLIIRYKITDQDVLSVIRTHEVLDKWLSACRCGKLRYWFNKCDLAAAIRAMSKDGIHQVGTTRIAMNAEDGVVGPDLRVWGTANLYVCSSSVFPTSGQANPTFLVGSFAARLAKHLSTKTVCATITS
ncbi:MAG: GMC oxidoreductase [Verrucomicrobiota bacterium]|jgi:hypothetical protein